MRRTGAGDQGRRRRPRVPRPADGNHAAQAAALLGLRSRWPGPPSIPGCWRPWPGLVAESTTYSLLQAGPEFREWLEHRPRAARADARPRVRVERDDRCWEVVLTRPDRHNALDARMRDELYVALDEARSRPDVTVALRGDGPSFCSGGDLDEFGTAPGPVDAHAVRLGRSLALLVSEMRDRIAVGIHGAC